MSSSADRRRWLPEAVALLGAAGLAVVLFATPHLDLAAARLFYRPQEADPWPLAHRLPWSALYRAAPWIAASLVLAGLGAVAAGAVRGRDALRRQGVFLLLSVVLGPGLLVNLVFKDHWGRPRPRDVVEFAGSSCYQPPLVPCEGNGASFPCGHCSVGFLYAAGWWIWRRRRPVCAATSLVVGVATGFALGLGRMTAGGHFLSDVVWSGLIALGVAHTVQLGVLYPRAREDVAARASRSLKAAVAALAALGGIGVLIALFVAPHGTSLAARFPLGSLPSGPWAFEFTARRAQVELVLTGAAPEIIIEGELHGFGLPTSTLATRTDVDDAVIPTVRYQVVQDGWFTDLDGSARIRLPVNGLRRVSVHIERGDIRVIDLAPPAQSAAGRPVLDLHTRDGRVSFAESRGGDSGPNPP